MVSPKDVSPIPSEVMRYLASLFDTHLNLPVGTLANTFEGDDWSFVIRAHALLESLVSLLLAQKLDPRLVPLFEMLELGREGTGKLAFAKALDAISVHDRKFVSWFSQLRNKLAHNPKYLSFNLEAYWKTLDKNQKAALVDALSSGFTPEQKANWNAGAEDNLRLTLRAKLIVVLMQLLLVTHAEQLRVGDVPPEVLSVLESYEGFEDSD